MSEIEKVMGENLLRVIYLAINMISDYNRRLIGYN